MSLDLTLEAQQTGADGVDLVQLLLQFDTLRD